MSCENCTKGYVLPGTPKGSIVNGAYFSPAPASEAPVQAKKAIFFGTDVFGLDLVNSKIMADKFAERLQMDVWVPDLFNGKPPVKAEELEPLLADRAGVKMTYTNIFRFVVLFVTRFFRFYGTRPSVGEARFKAALEKLKAEKGYEKIGVVGYCYGGTVAAGVGGTDLVSSIVIAHPGGLKEAQIRAIRVPASWACAEDDMSFKPAIRQQAEAIFAARKGKDDFVDYEFKDWKGTAHGFAVRPNLELPEVEAGYEGAFEQAVSWFQKTL